MTSDVRYASGEVPQVGDVVERVEYPIGYLSLGDQVTVLRIVNERSIDVGSDAVHYGIKQFKLIRRANHAQQPAPVETFVPTWGPEWEYVANHGTVFTFLLDDKSDVAPIKLACEFGDVWFSRDGAAAFGASWAIVSQRPRTPAPVETPAPSQPADVPQWCRDAAREWLSKLVCFSDKNDLIQMLGRHIARHANTNKTEEISPLVSLANVMEREKKDVGTNDRLLDFSNLEALSQGCVSGRVSEWPLLKTEAYRAMQLIKNQSAEIERLKTACSAQQNEIQQILGKALGYPRYCDDQANFPNATEADGVCVGEHVAESLASEVAAELTALRERLAVAEGERDEPKASFDLEDDGTPEYGTPAYELFDKAITWTVHQLKNVLGVKEWSTSGGGTDTLDGDLRMELNDLLKAAGRDDDSMEALRADLARAKEDGERMRVALVHLGSFFGCSAHLPWFSDDACDEVSAMIDEKGGEKRYDPAFYETYCAQVVTEIVTGAIDDSSGGGYIAELRRQKLEAHMRGDIRTADRLAALLGDPLPSEHEKADSALAALAEDRR